MKKLIIALFAILLPCCMFVGCGDSGVKNKTFVLESVMQGETSLITEYGSEGKNLRITFYSETMKVEVGEIGTNSHGFYYCNYAYASGVVAMDEKGFGGVLKDSNSDILYNFLQAEYKNGKVIASVTAGEEQVIFTFKEA